jgi:hypothetical protein
MPLRLTPDELQTLNALAAPLDGLRRTEFLGAVEKAIEAATPAAVGPGLVRRAGAAAQRDFRDVPADLRAGRLGPRGPRSA